MRNTTLLLLFMLVATTSFGQGPANVTRNHDYYLTKSKNQKTVAWVMLGGGVAVATVGILLVNNAINDDGSGYLSGSSGTAESIVALVGIGSTLGSIPLFVSSARNARKAARITFSNHKILFPLQNDFALQYVPTLTLKIPL
jgi:hypothetical protein